MTATLLFDLDGTLVETDPLHFQAMSATFAEHGVAVDWETYRARMIGKANAAIALEFLPHVAVGRHASIMDAKEAAYRALVRQLDPVTGLLALLDWADAAGVPCGVVTNAPRANAELVLQGLGLADRFAVLVIGPELDEAKPHPLPYLRGLAALGGEAAASLAFEDSPAGVTAATAAGLAVAGLLTSFSEAVLRGVGADIVVRDYTDPALMDLVRARTARRAPDADRRGPASLVSAAPLESVSPEKG